MEAALLAPLHGDGVLGCLRWTEAMAAAGRSHGSGRSEANRMGLRTAGGELPASGRAARSGDGSRALAAGDEARPLATKAGRSC